MSLPVKKTFLSRCGYESLAYDDGVDSFLIGYMLMYHLWVVFARIEGLNEPWSLLGRLPKL
ncbi:putative replication protein [Salmonella phage 41]|nr:putative replication protein [Salmonella phage 41]